MKTIDDQGYPRFNVSQDSSGNTVVTVFNVAGVNLEELTDFLKQQIGSEFDPKKVKIFGFPATFLIPKSSNK